MKEQIINFLWDMMFVLVASITACALINGKNNKKDTIKLFMLLFAGLLINLTVGIFYANLKMRSATVRI